MPITHSIFQVDAFASDVFSGNPAAVIVRDHWLDDVLMQNIAMENNLSETAFIVASDKSSDSPVFDLRWFTPTTEIEFCGHATIASAHVLMTEYGVSSPITFQAQIGRLTVARNDNKYVLDAPIPALRSVSVSGAMHHAFPDVIESAFEAGSNLYLVLRDDKGVASASPDMMAVKALSEHGVGITAKASGDLADKGYHCVSRFFVPAEGIDEDPVTGSAHAAIGPYWMNTLGRDNLRAFQASRRGGILDLRMGGEGRIRIAGEAVTYLRGEITLP